MTPHNPHAFTVDNLLGHFLPGEMINLNNGVDAGLIFQQRAHLLSLQRSLNDAGNPQSLEEYLLEQGIAAEITGENAPEVFELRYVMVLEDTPTALQYEAFSARYPWLLQALAERSQPPIHEDERTSEFNTLQEIVKAYSAGLVVTVKDRPQPIDGYLDWLGELLAGPDHAAVAEMLRDPDGSNLLDYISGVCQVDAEEQRKQARATPAA